MFFKESCFPDCWQTLSVVPVLRTIGERSVAQHHSPIYVFFLLFLRSMKLGNNPTVDHLDK